MRLCVVLADVDENGHGRVERIFNDRERADRYASMGDMVVTEFTGRMLSTEEFLMEWKPVDE